jgi:hypothetical protein
VTAAYAVSIGASATSVTAGQVSIITATVTNTSGSTSTPAVGVTVSFTLPIYPSGATLTAATATTDGSGKAIVIYQPGTTSPTLSLQDTVQAAVGTATSAVSITRTSSPVTPTDIRIDVAAAPNIDLSWNGQSVVTATVLYNSDSTPVRGITVTFGIVSGGTADGSLVTTSPTTDSNGNAVSVYKANNSTTPGGTSATDVVMVSVTSGIYTYTDGVVINVKARP